ncbi:MAG: hypothetical protein NC543_07645 [bacterium]|nr:hypothetical protein [bacterium]MCM1375352.1 hypothetical protein [Muribaculum sp.]
MNTLPEALQGMRIIGISSTEKEDGRVFSTLYVEQEFESYFDNPESGRICSGRKTDSVYVGDYDCSGLEPGMSIDILYGKAISTARGTYQPIRRIDVIESE